MTKTETAADHVTLTEEQRAALQEVAEITAADVDALQRALLTILADPDRGRVRQIRSMLKHEPWFTVATFAAYVLQAQNLRPKPWESLPCWFGGYHAPEGEYLELAKRLMRSGLSQYEPDPLQALEDVKASRSQPIQADAGSTSA
jgi:hypothetical protein